MSFKVSKIQHFPQAVLQGLPTDDSDVDLAKGSLLPTLGGVLADTRYVWHAKGPCLEIRDARSGVKVGAWTFGSILKDFNTRVVCVDEIQRPNGRLSLLAVAIECGISGSMVCVFEVLGSKVIRAVQIQEKVTSLHVVDSGYEVLNLPGPLRNFDGIVAVGTEGGNVYLVDVCRQICEESLHSHAPRDELYPCRLVLLTPKDLPDIEYYKGRSVRDGDHLAVHLNVVLDSPTQHFTLKGPGGEDRIHASREEVVASALYYCPQLTSLLVGFNFGAFQLWDLTGLRLVYTSPVCEDHLPITRFALQEPADDPRAFCYVWAAYSNAEPFQTGLPFAVMYALCYESKEYHEGYGHLYQDFQSCSVRFQAELDGQRNGCKAKGGHCVALDPVWKAPAGRELYAQEDAGDTLALCVVSWTVWFDGNETQTYTLLFDLNQWYKEQMPEVTKWTDCANYMLRVNVGDLAAATGRKRGQFLDVRADGRSLRQFAGVQRLEEHFCPSALSFELCCLREADVVTVRGEGLQRALLAQIEAAGPLSLIRPNDLYRQIVSLGLTPLFADLTLSSSPSTEAQREAVLDVALEHQLVAWLCRCAVEWANGSFSAAGCSLDSLAAWAFRRAVVLKTNCDRYCAPLFDHSQSRPDGNTSALLNSCVRQVNGLCTFYSYVLNNLGEFVSDAECVAEQHASLKMVATYFEVLQWLVNVGLLPEGAAGAPYPARELADYYAERRAQLRDDDGPLFVDSLIENKCGGERLRAQWRDDDDGRGGGLYPPPSLQSMLRAYLVEGADIAHKHSLVIYVFLDLAMALDQARHVAVVTHLIKFPAVFKVSSSVIKITQAFWQLDHGDYATAMEQLLDPFVLGDDLEPWHHAVAMRSLLMRGQHRFALLYLQVRRPPVADVGDARTAISLYVANGMLDEAFYFEARHRGGDEGRRLLRHLFEECARSDRLHALLYRCLDGDEERAFFEYLKAAASPAADDLRVFYYLLRSRFVEAFDAHEGARRKRPAAGQGLMAHQSATKTDQVVRMFKALLPDVNRDLVDVVRRERGNLWKEVARPTPLSVFVHNTNEQIQYRSTLIHAALLKAKHTFSDSLNSSKLKDVSTEDTPFLRTPKATRTQLRQPTPIITPKIINLNEDGEELGPSPTKRLKLTPRPSTTSPTKQRVSSIHSKMLTPIVKRKTSSQKDHADLTKGASLCTPQSILKVRNLVRNSDDTVEDMQGEELAPPRRSGLGLQPRKSLGRTPRRPQQVKFDDVARLSSSLSDQSARPSPGDASVGDKSTLSSREVSLLVSSRDSSGSNADEVFYSPDTSLSEQTKSQEDETAAPEPMEEERPAVETNRIDDYEEAQLATHSPKGRRSYKRSLGEAIPARSSPRLAKTALRSEKSDLNLQVTPTLSTATQSDTETAPVDASALEPDLPSSPVSRQSPRLLQKVKGRKSLTRKVLEHNTFSKMLSTPSFSDSVVKETSVCKTETITVSERSEDSSEVTTVKTKFEISDTTSTDPATPSSHRESKSSSVSKRKTCDFSNADSDTSIDSDILLGSPELPEFLKISDSLHEYMQSRFARPISISDVARDQSADLEQNPDDPNEDLTEKSKDSLEVTTVETKTDPATPSSHRESKISSVSKRKPSDLSNEDSDTSIDSDILLGGPELPEFLKISDSLHEYMQSRFSKPISISDVAKDQSADLEKSPDKELSEEVPDVEMTPPEETEKTRDESKSESKLTEVYEDLSSGAEDIAEVLSGGRRESSSPKVFAELSNYSDNTYDNLERNIFDITESREQSVDKIAVQQASENASISDNLNSESFYVPETEKAFIEDPTRLEQAGSDTEADVAEAKESPSTENGSLRVPDQQNEVIEIDSSSDQDDRTDSSESRSSENSESDTDELNISYERNIHVEEDSRSLVDSQPSRTTEDRASASEQEEYNIEVNLFEENILAQAEGSHQGSDLDTNEDDGSVEFMNDDEEDLGEKNLEPEDGAQEPETQEVVVETIEVLMEANDGSLVVTEEVIVEVESNKGNEEACSASEANSAVPRDETLAASQVLEHIMEENGENIIVEGKKIEKEAEGSDNEVGEETKPYREMEEDEVMSKDERSAGKTGTEAQGTQDSNRELVDQSNVKPAENVIAEKSDSEPQEHRRASETVEKETNTTKIDDAPGKRSQATNTTLPPSAESSPERETAKMERATNTTVYVPEAKSRGDETVLVTERPKERRVYHPKHGTMKVVSEDQALSSVSSDTTEGEPSALDIVVTAQVHAPTRKRPATAAGTRRTRRSSATAEQDVLETIEERQKAPPQTPPGKAHVADILEDSELAGADEVFTPERRTRRSLSVILTPTRAAPTRRSLLVDEPSTSEDLVEELPLRRARSLSVDVKKRSLRGASAEKLDGDAKERKPRGRGRAASVSHLPAISEEKRTRRNSAVESYAMTRRLTRRQASMVKGMETPSSVTAQDDSDVEKDLDVDVLDPIKLLDKEPFQGRPDPDEEKVYEMSSPSNSTTSSFHKPARGRRSASRASDSSLPPSASQASTPKRRGKRSVGHVDSPSGVTTRSRKQSETSSIASEKSEPASPPKRTKKKDEAEAGSSASAAGSTRSTRKRTKSTSSVASDKSASPKRTTRTRRLVSAKSDLPEIVEEKSNEGESGNKPTKRQTRKKSGQ